jgi:hypothetical protein
LSFLNTGTWDFTGISVYDPADPTCASAPIATCSDVIGATISPGLNTVNLMCDLSGADVTFDVILQ